MAPTIEQNVDSKVSHMQMKATGNEGNNAGCGKMDLQLDGSPAQKHIQAHNEQDGHKIKDGALEVNFLAMGVVRPVLPV